MNGEVHPRAGGEDGSARRPVDTADASARRPVDVAVGVLIGGDGRFLLAQRPPGKVYAGYWEFPGGKVEPGESLEAALARELHEELGIDDRRHPAVAAARWSTIRMRGYGCTSRRSSTGKARSRCARASAWPGALLPVQVTPVLPGTLPVLRWFAAERGHSGATHRE